MAPDWTTLETRLPALFGELLGIPCHWRAQPQKMQQGASAVIDLLAPTSIGVDDLRWTDVADPTTGAITGVQATIVGQRELTLQVSVWSPSQKLGSSARMYLERLRTRLRWPSTLATLKELGLAHVRTEGVVDIEPEQDNRVRSGAALDVRLAYAASEADVAIPYIETARVQSVSVRNAAGDPLPASVQVDVTANLTEP